MEAHVTQRRAQVGARSHHAGAAAERSVADHYRRAGHRIDHCRWRGRSGEIDLVARQGADVIFVEVKASGTHEQAAARISARQVTRLQAAAREFLAGEPGGQDTGARFDVALVDGRGRIEILPNAFL
ncbi:MAG: YraN family protein [Tranquillimonas sp.]|jgi:putative endonuclease